jgi:hypothetical protein
MSTPSKADVALALTSVVRLRRGLLSRATATGYLLHTGSDVVAISGLGAELCRQLIDGTAIETLVDRHAAACRRERSDVEATVLTALEQLHQRRALEVLA